LRAANVLNIDEVSRLISGPDENLEIYDAPTIESYLADNSDKFSVQVSANVVSNFLAGMDEAEIKALGEKLRRAKIFTVIPADAKNEKRPDVLNTLRQYTLKQTVDPQDRVLVIFANSPEFDRVSSFVWQFERLHPEQSIVVLPHTWSKDERSDLNISKIRGTAWDSVLRLIDSFGVDSNQPIVSGDIDCIKLHPEYLDVYYESFHQYENLAISGHVEFPRNVDYPRYRQITNDFRIQKFAILGENTDWSTLSENNLMLPLQLYLDAGGYDETQKLGEIRGLLDKFKDEDDNWRYICLHDKRLTIVSSNRRILDYLSQPRSARESLGVWSSWESNPTGDQARTGLKVIIDGELNREYYILNSITQLIVHIFNDIIHSGDYYTEAERLLGIFFPGETDIEDGVNTETDQMIETKLNSHLLRTAIEDLLCGKLYKNQDGRLVERKTGSVLIANSRLSTALGLEILPENISSTSEIDYPKIIEFIGRFIMFSVFLGDYRDTITLARLLDSEHHDDSDRIDFMGEYELFKQNHSGKFRIYHPDYDGEEIAYTAELCIHLIELKAFFERPNLYYSEILRLFFKYEADISEWADILKHIIIETE
jgi:hypothetical protein